MTIITPPPSDGIPSTPPPKLKPRPIHPTETPLPEPMSESVPLPLEISTPTPLNQPENDVFQPSTQVADVADAVKPSETLGSVEAPFRSLEIEDVPDKPLTAEAKVWMETLLPEKLEGLTEKQSELFLERFENYSFALAPYLDKNNQITHLEEFKTAYEGLVDHSVAQVLAKEDSWQKSPTLPKPIKDLRKGIEETLTQGFTETQLKYFQGISAPIFEILDIHLDSIYQFPSEPVYNYALDLIQQYGKEAQGVRDYILDPSQIDFADKWIPHIFEQHTQNLSKEEISAFESKFNPLVSSFLEVLKTNSEKQSNNPLPDTILKFMMDFEDGVA
ncbi:MAG: hypothetical protein HEQ32_05980 [Vampirovibrio sp.]